VVELLALFMVESGIAARRRQVYSRTERGNVMLKEFRVIHKVDMYRDSFVMAEDFEDALRRAEAGEDEYCELNDEIVDTAIARIYEMDGDGCLDVEEKKREENAE
jgi:hypothetical protein